MTDNRFDSLESAHQYISVLGEVLDDTQAALQHDIAGARSEVVPVRHLDALRLVDYKLDRLRCHLDASRRLLNDLRLLRRLLQRERDGALEALPIDSLITAEDRPPEPAGRT